MQYGAILWLDSRFLRAAQNHLSHYTYVTAHLRRRQCQPQVFTRYAAYGLYAFRWRGVHTPTHVCATCRILAPSLSSLAYIFRTCTRLVRGTRKRASRFAPLTRYTGCYNKDDVTSGISGTDREEEARSVGW